MTTSKRQVIITISIVLIAVIVIISSFVILKLRPDQTKIITTSHLFSDSDVELIRSIDKKVSIYLFRDEASLEKSSDTAEVSYRMLLGDLLLLNSKITVQYFSGNEANSKMIEYAASDPLDSVFTCENKTDIVKYSDIRRLHPVSGIVYAIDRGLLVRGLCDVSGIEYDYKPDTIAVTTIYDKDGDTINGNLRAFMYPSLERKDVKRIAVTNKEDSYFAYKASTDTSFVFAYDAGNGKVGEDGAPEVYTVNTSYDASMTSSLVVSSIYTLSTAKLYDVKDSDYGLEDKSKANLILEIFTSSNEYHIIVVGDKNPAGTGYFAKYYYLYAKDSIGSDKYIQLCQKADESDNIAEYTYAGKQFAGYGAEFYTKPYVYIIGSDIETAALHPLTDYLTGELVYTISDQKALYTVDDIRINFIDRGEELVANLLEESEATGTSMQYLWKIVSPKELFTGKYASPSDVFFDALNKMVTLSSEKVFEYKMKRNDDGTSFFEEEVLKKYGLDNPELSFSYRFDDETNKVRTRTEAFISAKDDNGKRYCYSCVYVLNEDGSEKAYPTGIIASLAKESCDWADKKTAQFIEPNIFNMFIQFVDGITVEFDGKVFDFVLLKDGEDVNDVACNGKKVDLKSFRYFYQTILGVKTVDKYEPNGEQLSEMLKLTIKTTKGEYDFVFSRISVKKALCQLNGEGSYYVNTDVLTKIETEAETIANGGTVEK